MIDMLLDILGWAFIGAGSIFLFIGGLGIIRLPDLYTRMHAAGVTDTMGAGLILAGLATQAPNWLVAVKLLAILIFLYLTSPTSSYALANSALFAGIRPVLARKRGKKKKTESAPDDRKSRAEGENESWKT